MKKTTFILLSIFLLFVGCKSNKALNTNELDTEELELWMINNSKEIKQITRSSFFRISNPKDYNREKLIQNIADSLNITAIQKLDLDGNKYQDLLVCGTKIPYLIINEKEPYVLRIRRNFNSELIAQAINDEGLIRVYEIVYGIGTKSIRQYDLILWNNHLIEPNKKPDFTVKKINYEAPGYEKRLYNIDMNGEILFFDYTRQNNEITSEKVWVKKGIVPKKHLRLLKEFLATVNLKAIKPEHIKELHTQNIKMSVFTTSGDFEIKDDGKRGAFSLMTLYSLFDEIIESTKFENVKAYNLDELYDDNFKEIKEIFRKEN